MNKKLFDIISKIKIFTVWKKIFIITAVIIGIAMPILSLDAGSSGDEHTWQYPHAVKIYNFYVSGGKDVSYKETPEMNPYGLWFEVLSVGIQKLFNIDDYQQLRHIMNSLMGFLAILFAGLLAKNCKNWRSGVFVLILLFLSPRFLGHSFNNPKDIPFAALFVISLYYIHKFILEYPKPAVKTCIKLAVAIALTIGIRVGGLLLYAYFGLFIFLLYIVKNKPKAYFSRNNRPILRRLFVSFICIATASFLLTIPLWPYIMENPIANTLQAFKDLSHFSVSIRQNFEGRMFWSDSLPWYYTPKFILISIPIAVIIGTIIYPFLGGLKKENKFNTFIIYFAFIFPLFWIVYSNANVYGGWRHSLFTYPPMAVASGLGYNALIDRLKAKYLKITATVFPFLLLIPTLIHMMKNHPYEYVYFNELAGSAKKAYGKYEMDYYYHSTRKASEWVIANARKNGLETGNRIKIATWHQASVDYYCRKDTANFEVIFSRWYERGNNDWDYGIFTVTGISPERIKGNQFPPANTVSTIDVDGKPIAVILKRDDKSDYYGYLQMLEGNADSAIILFDKALNADPNNEVVLLNITNIYLEKNQLDSAQFYLNRFLELDPNRENAKYLSAYIYYLKGDKDKSLAICREMNKYDKRFGNAYTLAAEIFIRQNDINSAEKEYLKLIDAGILDQNSFNQLILIYTAQGLDERTAYRKVFKRMAESYKKLGNKEAAKTYEEQVKKM